MIKDNKRVKLILWGFAAVFLAIIIYLVYFQLFKSESIADNSYNQRNYVDDSNIFRGLIYDRNSELLVDNNEFGGEVYRRQIHPYHYTQLIGYKSKTYGSSGLERAFNNYLLDVQGKDAISKLKNAIAPSGRGNDMYLTLDYELQKKAYELLNSRKGSIVAMNPTTGEVLAMVSYPTYDSNSVTSDWQDIISNESSPLLNRSIQGLYTPGSTMKIITSVALLESGIDLSYKDTGSVTIDGYTYTNVDDNKYGEIGLREALMHSSNTYFASKSQEIGATKLGEVTSRFMFGRSIPFDLNVTKSRINLNITTSKTQLASTSFGQGDTLVTPLQMCMSVAAIANDGVMMQPYVVDRILSKSGIEKFGSNEIKLSTVCSKEVADQIESYMLDTVKNRSKADVDGLNICGKTGTAQNNSGKNHAWFIGYSESENPKIAVAVILEEDGSRGSQSAAPIAGQLFKFYKNR